MEIDEMSSGSVLCGGRFPANTPITPPAIGLTQFSEKIMGEPLPGGFFREFEFFITGLTLSLDHLVDMGCECLGLHSHLYVV